MKLEFKEGYKPKCLVCNKTILKDGITVNGDHFHNECTPEGWINERKCFKCGEIQSTTNPNCISCIHSPNLTDNSVPIINELDGLFIGAPIVLNHADNKVRINYYDGISKANIDRLPTVKESPSNIWLAPWSRQPEELKELNIWCKVKNDNNLYKLAGSLWEEVVALMIVKDF